MGPPLGLPPFASTSIHSHPHSDTNHGSESHSMQEEMSGVGWELYFESKSSLHGRTVYRLNSPNTTNTYLFLLHGAGLSALSWALVAVRILNPFYAHPLLSSSHSSRLHRGS
jgi:hypothetical protein